MKGHICDGLHFNVSCYHRFKNVFNTNTQLIIITICKNK